VQTSQKDLFRNCIFVVEFITTSVHELLGHGTGKLLSETSPGNYNFDIKQPPINTLTGKPIDAWYKPGQTWTSVFGEIATAVEECRATLISYYLIDDAALLRAFGYSEESSPTTEDRK
jgi:dipeptidyl-peptidase-3